MGSRYVTTGDGHWQLAGSEGILKGWVVMSLAVTEFWDSSRNEGIVLMMVTE